MEQFVNHNGIIGRLNEPINDKKYGSNHDNQKKNKLRYASAIRIRKKRNNNNGKEIIQNYNSLKARNKFIDSTTSLEQVYKHRYPN